MGLSKPLMYLGCIQLFLAKKGKSGPRTKTIKIVNFAYFGLCMTKTD